MGTPASRPPLSANRPPLSSSSLAAEASPWVQALWRLLEPTRLLSVLTWAVVVFSCWQILLFSYGRDQSIYALVADRMLAGDMPYRDAWDFKTPGIFVLFAAAQALFGKAMSSIRIFEVGFLLAGVFALRGISTIYTGRVQAGMIAGALGALLHAKFEFWHSGQPESFGGPLTLVALYLVARERKPAAEGVTERSSLGIEDAGSEQRRSSIPPGLERAIDQASLRSNYLSWIAIGALFGLAFLLKPPLGGGAVVCAAHIAGRRRVAGASGLQSLLPIVIIGVASLLPILLCTAWFVARGAWPDLAWTLFEFTPGYTRLGWHGSPIWMFYYGFKEALAHFSWWLPLGCVLAFALPQRHSAEREGVNLFLGVVFMHVAGIALQAKFFQYHYGATLILLAFVAGVGLDKLHAIWCPSIALLRRRLTGSLAFVALWGALSVMQNGVRDVPHGFWARCGYRMLFTLQLGDIDTREGLDKKLYYVADYRLSADRQVAARVREITAATDAIFVWGFEPLIYWLSDRLPVSRYIYDVPQRVVWEEARQRARRELMTDLRRELPESIIVQRGDRFQYVTGDKLDSRQALATFPELNTMLMREYRLDSEIEDFEVYVRRIPR
ncbi:MAG: hypothetical protein HRU17_13465 [Polyangiaceae bacterium]|nr:hypothetical protein [Polyangiaceae bacterium]